MHEYGWDAVRPALEAGLTDPIAVRAAAIALHVIVSALLSPDAKEHSPMATLTLDPDNAAKSIAARMRLMAQCALYVRATMARYDGLKVLHTALVAEGVADAVAALQADSALTDALAALLAAPARE